MKKIILLFLFAVSFTGINAQEKSYKETLKEMLVISGSEETFKVAITQMVAMYRQQSSSVPVEVWDEVEKEFKKTSMDDLVDMLVPVYQKHLTLSDIQGIISFYKSPVGKKYAKQTPSIMQESMQVGAKWGAQLGGKIQDTLKEKGY